MHRQLLLLVLICFPLLAHSAPNNESSDPALVSNMAKAFNAFRGAYPLLFDEPAFRSQTNREKLLDTLTNLKTAFEVADVHGKRYSVDPGFKYALEGVLAAITDTKSDLEKGSSESALQRFKRVSEYCIACHTSYALNVTFASDPNAVKQLPALARGQFLLATRNFSGARESFLTAARSEAEVFRKLVALRGWLRIVGRTDTTPSLALKELAALEADSASLANAKLALPSWKAALEDWNKDVSRADSIEKAKSLIGPAKRLVDPTSEIKVLRGTGMLHRILENGLSAKDRSEVLFELGVGYTKVPENWAPELGRQFLVASIYGLPKSDTAKAAYGLLSESLSFNPITGEPRRVSSEDALSLNDLRDVAYGTPKMDNRL